ncbi:MULTISPECIES: hypothetical protein [Thermoprotei]|uniref:hypothetical protein n=1 Tax=Thermoprotei TaxID=183924 RepID=UPI003162B0FB
MSKNSQALHKQICEQLMDFSEFARLNGNAFEYIVYVIRNMVYNSPDRRCTIEDVMFCLEDKAKKDKRLQMAVNRARVFQAVAHLKRRGEIKKIRFILDGKV